MRSTIHERSHLARGPRTQVVENKKPYISAFLRIRDACAMSMRRYTFGGSK